MEGMRRLKKGTQQGQERINQLIILISRNKTAMKMILRLLQTKEYQEKLLKEFNL